MYYKVLNTCNAWSYIAIHVLQENTTYIFIRIGLICILHVNDPHSIKSYKGLLSTCDLSYVSICMCTCTCMCISLSYQDRLEDMKCFYSCIYMCNPFGSLPVFMKTDNGRASLMTYICTVHNTMLLRTNENMAWNICKPSIFDVIIQNWDQISLTTQVLFSMTKN